MYIYLYIEPRHASSIEWYIYIDDNETSIQLSSNEWNIIIQTKKSETDEMLKRVHNPFIQIRQATRRLMKEEKN